VKAEQVKLSTTDNFRCSSTEGPTTEGDGKTYDQVWTGCGPSGGMLLQRVVATGTNDSLLIQVLMPGDDRERAREIAGSVRSTG